MLRGLLPMEGSLGLRKTTAYSIQARSIEKWNQTGEVEVGGTYTTEKGCLFNIDQKVLAVVPKKDPSLKSVQY